MLFADAACFQCRLFLLYVNSLESYSIIILPHFKWRKKREIKCEQCEFFCFLTVINKPLSCNSVSSYCQMVVAFLLGIGKVSGRLQEVQRMLLLQWSYYIKLCTGPRHNLAQLLLPSAQFFFFRDKQQQKKIQVKAKSQSDCFP